MRRKNTKGTLVLGPNAKHIVRNLMMLKDGTVLAGYRIGPRRWDFTGRDMKLSAIHQDAEVWAELAGRSVIEKVSAQPHPVRGWAERLDQRTPRPTPDVHTCDLSMSESDMLLGRCGCETWNTHLTRMQSRIVATGMDDKVTFRYFSVGKVKPSTDLRGRVLQYVETGELHASIKDVIADEKRVREIVSGWHGTKAMSEFEQAWARNRAMAPGVQPSPLPGGDGWGENEIAAISADTRWEETPFDRTVTIHTFGGGEHVQTAVRVLTLARCADLDYPDNGMPPWQSFAENAKDAYDRPFSVEWCITGRLRTADEMEDEVERDLRVSRFIKRDYEEFDELPPAQVEQAIAVAKETRDQVTTGQAAEAVRFEGQVNVIISAQASDGRTAQENVEARCAAFARMYSGGALKMVFVGAGSQSAMLQSTIPGEPVDTLAYQRRIRLPWLAAGMPTTTNLVGDMFGPYLGFTRSASPQAVKHDPHYATEGLRTGRSQNMWVVLGTLGAGKSVLTGSIIYNATRRGIRCVVSDPSGPLADLTRIPEIAAVSQEVNLLRSKQGILSPPGLIREPERSEFDTPGPGEPDPYEQAVAQAQAERRDLVVDMARRCCPEDLYKHDETRDVLREAARRHQETRGWLIDSTMWDLMEALRHVEGRHAASVHGALKDASTAPLLSLMFPPPYQKPSIGIYGKTLTVITTPGIQRASDGIPRADWTPMELGADAVLRLVAFFTERLIYTKARSQRCIAVFDEAETLTDVGSGRAALQRLGRDHSKWNTAVYLCVKSINPQMLSNELKNFVAGAFVGKMADREPAVDALGLLGLTDERYADILLNLSRNVPGEFLHHDVDGNTGGLIVDVDYHPGLKAALLTDPIPEGSNDWSLIEEDAL